MDLSHVAYMTTLDNEFEVCTTHSNHFIPASVNSARRMDSKILPRVTVLNLTGNANPHLNVVDLFLVATFVNIRFLFLGCTF